MRLPPPPFLDLRGRARAAFGADALAALTVTFLAIPQGIAYATIADLPPVMGLYASALPTVVGALLRSSRHVVAGPSNALSLLVGGALAAAAAGQAGVDPMVAATTLALMVGVMQVLAGALRLGALIDYISRPVVLGYITGAGLLIAIGQLHNLTGTVGGRGGLIPRVETWWGGVGEAAWPPLAMGGGVIAVILLIRTFKRRWPGAMIALAGATAVTWAADLRGPLRVVGDISPVPQTLPPISWPDLGLVWLLLPAAVAATVLSLVESTAVARAIAARTGQRLVATYEFIGQGVANLVAGLTTGYPVSGSLSRSALNERAGAVTRMAGVYGGLIMLLAPLVLAPVFDLIPIAALAGLLMVVAVDLVDRARIAIIMRSNWGDRAAFSVTMVGTWLLSLDQAIYLGVAVSLVKVLYDARRVPVACRRHPEAPLAVAAVSGRLFFGVEEVIRAGLADAIADPEIETLVIWLGESEGMDVSVATLLVEIAAQLDEQGRRLALAGVSPGAVEALRRTGHLTEIPLVVPRGEAPAEGAMSAAHWRWASGG